jgi:hypothetical protein
VVEQEYVEDELSPHELIYTWPPECGGERMVMAEDHSSF